MSHQSDGGSSAISSAAHALPPSPKKEEGGAAATIAAADEGLIPLLSRLMMMELHAGSPDVQVASRAAPPQIEREAH